MNNALIKYPLFVFLDSNVFISESYNFSEYGSLDLLKKQIDAGKVVLLVSDIVLHEVKKHISDDIICSVDKYENARNKVERGFAIFRGNDEYSYLFSGLEKAKMVDDAIQRFEQYITETNSEILDNAVDIDKILVEYFNGLPPFGPGRKKNEFPDAIMISKLKDIVEEYGSIFVISKDNDFVKALSGVESFTCFSTIKEFLNEINKHFGLHDKISAYLNKGEQQDYIHDKILMTIHATKFNVNGGYDLQGNCIGYEYDETEVNSVEKVEYALSSIDNIDDKNSITITISCKANVEFACSFFDEENSIWDSVDKEYFHEHYGIILETHNISFDVIVMLLSDQNGENFTIKEMTFDFSYTDVDEDTLIRYERFDAPDELYGGDDDILKNEEGYNTCPACGKEINHFNDGGNGFCVNCVKNHFDY